MEIEKQVCSFELAKKLKELGASQDSFFYWKTDESREMGTSLPFLVANNSRYMQSKGTIEASAPTVAELGEMLPLQLFYHYDGKIGHSYLLDTRQTGAKGKSGNIEVSGWYIRYFNSYLKACIPSQDVPFIEAETEADARAKMLIHLIESGLVQTQQD